MAKNKLTKEALFKAREEFLNETVEYYSKDIKRRSFRPLRLDGATRTQICLYMHPSGRGGCAIGRKLKASLRQKLDRRYENAGMGSVNNLEIFEQLPLSLQKLGKNFLVEIQNLHDLSDYWDEHGLTGTGEREVEAIRKVYCK